MGSLSKSVCIVHPYSELTGSNVSFSSTDIVVPSSSGKSAVGEGSFVFDRVFEPKSSQETIFQELARNCVHEFLERFHSAAFVAFGASGSGKTFAVTGGAKRFSDRGLIPRSISALFEGMNARGMNGIIGASEDREDPSIAFGTSSKEEYEVTVAFYEIYKDSVVDLLSEQRGRVNIEEKGGRVTLPNLTWRSARSESDAYHILFQGDANRHFERHALNPETSRGHVFFVLRLLHRPTGREADLSFIDLAATINVRNKATASITRSLEALRTAVSGLQSGAPPSTLSWDASPLTQLLKPMLVQTPQEPVNLVALYPIRFTEQTRREVRSWLKFALSIREVVMGASGMVEEVDEAPPADFNEDTLLNNGAEIKGSVPTQVTDTQLIVAPPFGSTAMQDVISSDSPNLEVTRLNGVDTSPSPVMVEGVDQNATSEPLQLVIETGVDSDRVPASSNSTSTVTKPAKVAVPCLPLSNLGNRNGVDRGAPVVVAPPQAQYSKIQPEAVRPPSPHQPSRGGASTVPVPVPKPHQTKPSSAQGTPNPTPAYPSTQVIQSVAAGVKPPVPQRASGGRVVQETWQTSPALCARSPSAATRSTTPIRFVARPLGSGYASPQPPVSPMRSVPHRNIEVRAPSPVPSPAPVALDRKPRVNAYAHTGASPQPSTPSGNASGVPTPAASTAARALSPQPPMGVSRQAAASPTPQRLMQLSGSHRSTTPMRAELAARTCTPPAKVSYANTRFMSPTPKPSQVVTQQPPWQFGAPPPVPATQHTFVYR